MLYDHITNVNNNGDRDNMTISIPVIPVAGIKQESRRLFDEQRQQIVCSRRFSQLSTCLFKLYPSKQESRNGLEGTVKIIQ